jgi:hypothetical protein
VIDSVCDSSNNLQFLSEPSLRGNLELIQELKYSFDTSKHGKLYETMILAMEEAERQKSVQNTSSLLDVIDVGASFVTQSNYVSFDDRNRSLMPQSSTASILQLDKSRIQTPKGEK